MKCIRVGVTRKSIYEAINVRMKCLINLQVEFSYEQFMIKASE